MKLKINFNYGGGQIGYGRESNTMIPLTTLDWIPLLRGLLAAIGLSCTIGLIAVTVASSVRQQRTREPRGRDALDRRHRRVSAKEELVGAA